MRSLYAMFMRHLELHVIETEHDIDLALQAGLLELDRLDATECVECGVSLGYSDRTAEFEPFTVVIDESDTDWSLCLECASPVIDGELFESDSDSVEWIAHLELQDDDSDELEQF